MIRKMIFLLPLLFVSPLHGRHLGWSSAFSLPQSEIDQHFADVQKRVISRWETLTAGLEFPPFSAGRSDESIVEEFHHWNRVRTQNWFKDPDGFPVQANSLFKVSQTHLLANRFRQPNCITFEHTATDPSYNSSTLTLGQRRFFALEGPLEEHVSAFFRLLENWNVASLVCLTNDVDKTGFPKCTPYWKGRVVQREGEDYLQIPIMGQYLDEENWTTKEIPYLFIPDWKDHHGLDPEELVRIVNRVREDVKEGEILAVHCSAGVGRTGTFIATVALLDEIDALHGSGQFSIARLFLYLSLHRPWLVSTQSQYLTLYRVAEWYQNHVENVST